MRHYATNFRDAGLLNKSAPKQVIRKQLTDQIVNKKSLKKRKTGWTTGVQVF